MSGMFYYDNLLIYFSLLIFYCRSMMPFENDLIILWQ